MKKILIILPVSLLLMSTTCWITTIYNYSVPKIEGGNQAISAYTGKKILVVTLPITQTASADSMLYSLDTIASNRITKLQVIAVPAYEDGFTTTQKTQLQQWYRSKLSNAVIITDGLYTRKTSGLQQHSLFKWLTNETDNEEFNIDVEGIESKFFTDNTGHLYAVIKPQSKMWGATVQRTLNMQ